jgi:murein DD-endopeptidase MepM/ murein hydrolase activator NlpD
VRVGSGRSAARLARLVRDQEVGGSTPLAPTISTPRRTPAIVSILLCVALASCASAPKYRAGGRVGAGGESVTAAPGAEVPALGVDLRPPLKNLGPDRVTSPFRRTAGAAGRRHDGIDLKAAQGEEVLAAAAGSVAFSGHRRGYGNLVIIDHGGGITTAYGHLFYATVRRGDRVGAGQRIGRAGRRGRATGTHLHFEVRRNGVPLDPAPYLWLDSQGRRRP